MAAPKPPKAGESSLPRLYTDDDGDDGAAQLDVSARLAVTIPAESTGRIDAAPATVRALNQTGEYDDTARAAAVRPGRRLPNVDDSIPNIADDDGTHTDQTALLTDRSLRRGDRPTLTILTGMSAGLVCSLEKLPLTIGRLKGVELQITDAGVSRKHARVIMRVAERKECVSAAAPRDLVALADQRLYAAKQSARIASARCEQERRWRSPPLGRSNWYPAG